MINGFSLHYDVILCSDFSKSVDSYLQLNYNLSACNIYHVGNLITIFTDFTNSDGTLRNKTKFNFCLYCNLLGHKLK